MSLTELSTTVVLDVYDHDTTPLKFKAIALDSKTRYVNAHITDKDEPYDIGQGTTVTLTVIRPDKTGVQITGTTEAYSLYMGDSEVTLYGARAELTQTALAVSGTLQAQFMFTSGEQIIRTEIFTVYNGVALDATVNEWAGEYQGYNLDELVQSVNSALDTVTEMETDVAALKEDFNDLSDDLRALEQDGYPMASIQDAVTEWIDNHDAEIINKYASPETYGAKGDGRTDDSLAFQRAVDTGMPVYLAKKSYVVRNITSATPLKIIGENATIITVEAENGSNQFSNVFTSSQGIDISGVTFVGLGAASSATTNRFISVIKVTGGIVSITGCKFINFNSLNTMSASDAGLDRTGMLLTAVGCDKVSIINSTFTNISGDEIMWIISNNGNGEHTIANNIFDNVTAQSINVLYGNCLIKDNTFNLWNSHTSIFNINGKALIATKNRFIGCIASDVFDCYEAGYMRCNTVLLDGNILINCKDLRFANLCADSITICNNSVSCGTFVRVANYMATQSVFPFDNSNAKRIESVTICNNYVKLFMNETSAYIAAGLQIMYRDGISATVVDNSLPLKNVLVAGNVFDCNPELALGDLAEGYKSAFIFALGNKIDAIRIKGNTFKNMPHPFRITSSSTMLVYVQMYYERSIGFFEFDDLVVDRDELVSNTIFYYLYFRVESGYVSTYPCVAAIEYGKIYFTNLSPFSDPRRFTSNNTSAVSVIEYADPYA